MERIGKICSEIAQIESLINSGYCEDVAQAKADIKVLEAELNSVADEIESEY